MDILCSDKTGTLTENVVVLQYHLNIHGKEDLRVLRHAYLNSNFQTGLKNLLDIAIIDKAVENQFYNLNFKYKKIDEIPFDFGRRRMSVVLKDDNGKIQMITKGAIEEMFNICKYVEYNGEVIELNEKIKKEILENILKLNNNGMRVLALAQKNFIDKNEEMEDVTKYGEFISSYFAWLTPERQKKRAKEIDEMTKQ